MEGGFVGGGREEEFKGKVQSSTGGKAVQTRQKYVPKYVSEASDILWASKGVVVTVLNGEAIPVLQRRIFDAGFEKLDIIPLGADEVIVRSPDGEDVSVSFSEAPNFFSHFFSTPVKWNKDVMVCERGAWVRIYGVPLHAWNINFFKLYVLDCGRLLKVDDCTLEKERFDFSWVLISTTSLEAINADATLLIDGVIFNFKIIEEWGFNLGDDACLIDEDDIRDGRKSDTAEILEDDIVREDVEDFVNHLSNAWDQEAHAHDAGGSFQVERKECTGSHASVELKKSQEGASCSSSIPLMTVQKPKFVEHKASSYSVQINEINMEGEQQEVMADGRLSRDVSRGDCKISKRTTSCPPGRVHAVTSGPWSLKWISRQKNADKITFNKNNSADISRGGKKKGGGVLSHNAQSLKRIVCLPAKDRNEILRALQKTFKKRRGLAAASKNKVTSVDSVPQSSGSQVSVNNDWVN